MLFTKVWLSPPSVYFQTQAAGLVLLALQPIFCSLSQPSHSWIQKYRTNTDHANALSCSIPPWGTTANHNFQIPCLFQQLTTTFTADWKYVRGVIWSPLSYIVWIFMQAGTLRFKVTWMALVMTQDMLVRMPCEAQNRKDCKHGCSKDYFFSQP